MSYYTINLDKARNLKYGMRAIDLIEKKFKKPVMQIEGLQSGVLSMDDYATLIWAGLVHEDKDLTPEKVMDLIDEHSSLTVVSKEMWVAFNEAFADDEEEKEVASEGKNE
jgi:hypothetical protein